MDYFRQTEELLHLIFLDIKMPLMNGRGVLAEIVNDDGLRHIPIVVLSTSESGREVVETHHLQCNSYVTKPIDFDDFQDMISKICNYWFSLVALPSSEIAAANE